jgi:cell division protein FtsL
MVIPLTDVGAVKATETCPLLLVTALIVGALGTSVAANTHEGVLTSNKATKQDLKSVTGEWCAMFIRLSSGGHTKNIENDKIDQF